MQIVHKIDDFLFTIFPELLAGKNDNALITNTLEKYYTYGPYKPKVSIENDWVKIEIDTTSIISQEADYKKAVALCEKGNYNEAKSILKNLIEKNPTISEYHRIMGQILSDEGDQEEAINCLIDALRWDSKNGWALLMMGNIFAKFKNEVSIAMKYYDQAILANAMDNISLTNIGYLFLHQNKLDQAKKYFWEALKINNEYPNTHFALGMIAEMENDLHSAFYSSIQALKLNKSKDELYQKSLKQAFEIAKKISATDVGKRIYREYRHKLEFEGDREIDIVQDSEIPTAAKMEFAENYERPKHLVKYKPSYPAVEHLVMHELVHLDFVIEARKAAVNQLFISTQEHKNKFIKELDPTIKKFQKMGISEKGISDYCSNLFDGLNSQVFNTPIDLFIENFLYQEFAELRPYQFLSLFNMIQEGLKAVTDKKIIELSPAAIISKSKIYNLVNAIQFKELFGMDFIKDFNASKSELTLANDFYEEFLQYKEDKEPAEEYELLLHWAEDLKLDKNFELVGELQYRKSSNIDDFMNALEKDPFGVNEKDPAKDREMKKFQQAQAELGINMAVVMFMVDALQFFEGMPIDEVRKIAYEIAFQGTQGYNPDKKDYRISAIKGKTFSGYHILAYYYVSWSLAVPVSLPELKLPYEEEYKLAKTMHKP
ncbi:MAG: tetratricopeptide repeat protein [Lutibacter sp.]|nr:tetratricopeptide repeat protein [Lutibacter sp.]